MFGYIVANKQEMKFKEFDEYHRYYCGLCKALKDCKGARGQMSLSYDMTFLVLLLTGLYEPVEESGLRRCGAHPFGKHQYVTNCYSDYAAAMNVVLTYYKCVDDWKDEKKLTRKLYASLLGVEKDKAFDKYQAKLKVVAEKLDEISVLEAENSHDLDALSGLFGEALAEVFVARDDEWADELHDVGYYLGRFVYIMDAYEDVEKDIKKKNFNPLLSRIEGYKEGDVKSISLDAWQSFAQWTKEVLMLMASECAKAFEKLPIIKNVEILRNILYSGMWISYYAVTDKRLNSKDK